MFNTVEDIERLIDLIRSGLQAITAPTTVQNT